MNLQEFDIKGFLIDYSFPFVEEGKNVSDGWIGINCFWCDDQSNHLGINLDSKLFKCWRCGQKGPSTNLAKMIGNLTSAELNTLIRERYVDPFYYKKKENTRVAPRVFFMPKACTVPLTPIYQKYLMKRNLVPQNLVKQYEITCCLFGPFSGRIIIPIIMNKKIVGFTSRKVNDKGIRYLHFKESQLPTGSWLYNIDTVTEGYAFLLEGPFDVFKLGPSSVGNFGLTLTEERIKLLRSRNIDKLFIIYDKGEREQRRAEEHANILSSFIQKIEVITLNSKGDVGDLTPPKARELRNYLV